ncbi:geminin coiled-coil domain-containing protein 1-like [Salvelinus fontinalis]|uniref:geminin coiled-coil domain-containing protein 1-like n=1 Tax=Salvelinus fontinalis TaxID=8038 RepID=UPI0024852222|nr:geminin coiled-coil domain-containing protein 1-like [Salvelinus fontinalis]
MTLLMSYPSCMFVLQRTAQTCQDLSFVGGQLYDCPYTAPTSADSVDVSTVTLASFWADGSPDNTACLQEPTQRELLSRLDCGTSPPDPNWNDHLLPHLQRNKQLQDTLIQREEELARLQEENNNLKEFLNSSCVKALDEKTKSLLSAQSGDGRRNRKRNSEIQNLHGVGEFRNLSASQLLLGSQVKRTCRNLSLEFCSEEELACTDSVDLWILHTLGLKDEDTIDTSSTEYSFNCSISSLTKSSSVTDSSGDYCQTTDHKNTAYDSPTDGLCNGASIGLSNDYCFNTNSDYSLSTDSGSDFTGTVLSVLYSPSIEVPPNFHVTPYEPPLPQSVNTLSPPDPIQSFRPILASSPNLSQDRSPGMHHTPSLHCRSLSSPIGGDVMTTPLSTPHSQTELAFSMSLNPSSSVRLKTHSFPQGQAFVRKNTQGGWNFTWVPKQGP